MRPVSDFLLTSRPVSAAFGDMGEPETKKTTPTNSRVALSELELTYSNNPLVFNSTNKIVQTIMSSKHYIVAKDKKVETYFRQFVKNLGNSGSDTTWDELLASMFKHQVVFGKAFTENIFNKNGNRIVDWDIVDPKTIQYAKDANGKIVTDKFGRPVGYFQVLPFTDGGTIPNTKLPDKVVPPTGEGYIYLDAKYLAQIKLYSVGDNFYPIGLIETVYKDSLNHMNIKEAFAKAIWRHGFPIIWAQLGDLNHEPNPKQIQNILAKLKNINNKQEIATPYYYDLKILESKRNDKMPENIEYFENQIVTGMGVPAAIATGVADGATYATLNSQNSMYMLTLRDIVNKTVSAIEKYMFRPLAELEGFKEVPQIKWSIMGNDELDKKARRIMHYVKSGVLDPSTDIKLTDFVKMIEQIDYDFDTDGIEPDLNDSKRADKK